MRPMAWSLSFSVVSSQWSRSREANPDVTANGVRISWVAMPRNLAFTSSARRCSVTSRKLHTRPTMAPPTCWGRE